MPKIVINGEKYNEIYYYLIKAEKFTDEQARAHLAEKYIMEHDVYPQMVASPETDLRKAFLLAKTGDVTVNNANSNNEAPQGTGLTETKSISDAIKEAVKNNPNVLAGKVNLAAIGTQAYHEKPIKPEAEGNFNFNYDWKLAKVNNPGNGSLLPDFSFPRQSKDDLVRSRDQAANEAQLLSTRWKSGMELPDTTVTIGNNAVNSFTVSFVNAWASTGDSAYNTVAHPVDTVKGIANAAKNVVVYPEATWDNLKGGLQRVTNTALHGTTEEKAKLYGSGLGHLTSSVLLTPLARKVGKGLGEEETVVQNSGRVSPSKLAQSWQGIDKYPGVDRYRDITIKKGTVIYRGEPNGTEYFTTKSAIKRADGDAKKLFEGLQVEKHELYGYRPNIQGYLVNEDIDGAFSITKANPRYGDGGLPQVFVPDANELIKQGILVPIEKKNLVNYK